MVLAWPYATALISGIFQQQAKNIIEIFFFLRIETY